MSFGGQWWCGIRSCMGEHIPYKRLKSGAFGSLEFKKKSYMALQHLRFTLFLYLYLYLCLWVHQHLSGFIRWFGSRSISSRWPEPGPAHRPSPRVPLFLQTFWSIVYSFSGAADRSPSLTSEYSDQAMDCKNSLIVMIQILMDEKTQQTHTFLCH